MVKIQVPATTANVGPGFDILGIALNLYNYIEIDLSESYEISFSGTEYKTSLSKSKNNLFYTSMAKVYEQFGLEMPNFKINIDVNIPLSRGLGSSSSAIVSGVVSANHFLGNKLNTNDLLKICNDIEGHPDNIAPCLLGGIVISAIENDNVITQKIQNKNQFKFIAVIPDFELSTKEARKALPEHITYADSIFNSSRLSMMIMALINGDNELLSMSLNDKLHQQYRGRFIKGFDEVINIAKESGAIGAVLSGAGPTILAITDKDENFIAQNIKNKWNDFGIKSRFEILEIDNRGCHILNI